jgi:hypothetical protein
MYHKPIYKIAKSSFFISNMIMRLLFSFTFFYVISYYNSESYSFFILFIAALALVILDEIASSCLFFNYPIYVHIISSFSLAFITLSISNFYVNTYHVSFTGFIISALMYSVISSSLQLKIY